jgi:hypothetical protein
LFVDGRLQKEDTDVKGGLSASPLSFRIGAGIITEEQLEHFFRGLMYQVRISRVERYTQDFTPPETLKADRDTIAAWSFEQPVSTEVADLSGHGHTAYVYNANSVPLWGDSTTPPGEQPPVTPADWASVDLLPLIDVETDIIVGTARRDNEAVVIAGSDRDHVVLQVPYIPPEEYDVEAVVTRTGAPFQVGFGIPVGSSYCDALVDEHPNSGFRSGLAKTGRPRHRARSQPDVSGGPSVVRW